MMQFLRCGISVGPRAGRSIAAAMLLVSAADFVARAFDRFARADEAHADAGAGLGLAIVQAIAVAHDGTAHVRADGGPADVWISLPADPTTW